MRLANDRRRQLQNCGRSGYGADSATRCRRSCWGLPQIESLKPEPGRAFTAKDLKACGPQDCARSACGVRLDREVSTCLLHRGRHRGFASTVSRRTNRLAESRSSTTAARNRNRRTTRIRQRTDGLTFALTLDLVLPVVNAGPIAARLGRRLVRVIPHFCSPLPRGN